jgi:Uncharacterised BCR, YnfA/UPF0060 family
LGRPSASAAFGGIQACPGGHKVILANATSAPRRDAPGYRDGMTVLGSIVVFALAALAEIGGAWRVWQGIREHRGLVFVGAGILALGLYGFAATFQPDPHFGRIWPPTVGCSWPAAGLGRAGGRLSARALRPAGPPSAWPG